MASFYDQLVEQEKQQPAEAAPSATPSFYDQLVQDEQEQGKLQASVNLASQTTPEQAARHKYLSNVTGMPLEVVRTAEGQVQAMAKFKELRDQSESSPVLRSMLMNPDFTSLAQDDAASLSTLEKLGSGIASVAKYVTSAPGQETGLLRDIGAAGYQSARMVAGLERAVGETAGFFLNPIIDATLPENALRRMNESLGRAGEYLGQQAKETGSQWAPDSLPAQIFGGGASSAVTSVVQSLGAGTAAFVLAPEIAIPLTVAMLAAGQGGDSYQKAREQGASWLQALMHGGEDAAAEYIGERYLGLGGFLERAAKGAGIKELAKYELVNENIGETLTTLWQNFNEWANLNQDKSFGDFLGEQPAAIAQTLVATTLAGGAHLGLSGTINKALGEYQKTQQAGERAQLFAEHMKQVLNAALQTKLFERDKTTFAGFMQQVSGESVYIDASVMNEIAQTPEGQVFLQSVPDLAQQLTDAVPGSTIALPVSQLAAHVPGTTLEQPLLENMRSTPDALSLAESKAASAQADEFAQSAQTIIDQAADSAKMQLSADAVKQLYLDQLKSANIYTADKNEVFANMMRSAYTVLGGRLNMTPEQAYRMAPLKIRTNADIGETLNERITSDFDSAVSEYATIPDTEGGKVLNTDLARELSPEYRADRSRSAEVHEAASSFINQLYTKLLAKKGKKGSYVLFTAGGTGAGKSTGLRLFPELANEADVVFDGTMSKFESADKKIQQALKSGREVRFMYVYRDPAEALQNGALPRAMRSGRTAPLSVLQESHVGARTTVDKLAEKYKNDPRVSFVAIDNSKGPNGAEAVALAKIPQVSDNGLAEKLNEILETEYQAGRISDAVYRGTSGVRAASSTNGGQNAGVQQPAGNAGVHPAGVGGQEQSDAGTADESAGQELSREQRKLRQAMDLALVAKGTDELNQSLSTRLPTSDKATENPFDDVLVLSFDVALSDTKTLEKNVKLLQGLPNMRKLTGKGARDPVRNAEAFVDHVVSNLLWLHDQMPQDWRERAELWYDGGRKTAEAWAQRYGVSEMQAAAMIAVLSPQNGWFANVSQAERILDAVFGMRDFKWDDAMTAEAHRITDSEPDKKMQAAMGKTLGELLATPDIAARWVRIYDQAHNNRAYRVLTPEGGAADYVKTGKGADATMAWKSYLTISKAISIATDGRAENVYVQLGKEHKVRNFYNNIFDPNSPLGFATIDTHAVAAALLRPLSSSDDEVNQAFGTAGSSSSNFTGLNGTYPIYHEAYRRAAEARGIQPRQMQSITWEAVRGLFEASQKRSGNTRGDVEAIWERYKNGQLSQEQAQAEILKAGGGITAPSWTDVPFTDTVTRTYEGPAQAAVDARGDVGSTPSNPTAKVMFEVAPDPNDAQLTAEWNALAPEEKLRISQAVAAQMVPKILKELGTDGDFVMQLGGYEGATNPSMTLRVARPELAVQAAKLLGHALAQDSMMVVTEDAVLGASPVGAVTLQLPEGWGTEQVTQLYDKLWELEHDGSKIVGGHTTANGQMAILNYSDLSDEELAARIDQHLGGAFSITINQVHSAFPSKEEYGYASNEQQGSTPAGKPSAQERPDRFRSEATQLLRDALDARGNESDTFQQSGVNVTGIHYSRQTRSSLNGAMYGTGLKGLEADRVLKSEDKRLRNRVYFYVDDGKGVRPEAGVGGLAHEAQLSNLYDAKADPLKLWRGDINAIESAVLDAGFDGYYISNGANQQGYAVVMGPASNGIPVTPIANPATGALPTQSAPQPYKRGLMSSELKLLDIDAIKAAAPSAQLKAGTFSVDPAEFAAAQAAARAQGVDLPGGDAFNQAVRGTFNPKTLTMTLLEDADLSTFLHETGHFFLTVLTDIAARADAPVGIREDADALMQWFGIKGATPVERLAAWHAMSIDQQRAHHERFAESFELYLFEGKAPSADMQPLFQRFRQFLFGVYKSMQQFVKGKNLRLSDEVRGVMDRLLASDEEINKMQVQLEYEALFATKPATMSDEEWIAYQSTNAAATVEASEQLQKRSLADLKWTLRARSKALKEISKGVEQKRKAMEAEVAAEVRQQPVYAVQRWLKTGVMPDGTKTEGAKLSTQALQEMYGDSPAAPWRYLATNMLSNSPELSMHPDIVAEMFGFQSGDAMVRSIVAAFPEDSAIQGITEQRMLETYGDMATPAGIERAANEAVHNESRARSIATELKALAQSTSPARVMARAAKQFAEQLVSRRKIRELKPGEHTAAETRAARRSREASAAGKTQDALVAKRDQLLNFYAAKQTLAAQDEIERKVKALRKLAESTSLPPEYQEQIDKLLERVELKSRTNKDLDKRASLAEWVKSQEDIGIEPDVPPELLAETQLVNYRDLTVEQFRGLYDTIKQIEHLGRLKDKLLTAKDKRDFAVIRDAIAESIRTLAGDRKADTRTPNTVLGEALVGLQKFWASHIKAATLARVMDGGQDGGPVWEYLIRTANEAGNNEVVMREQATTALAALVAPVLEQGKLGGKGVYFPTIDRSLNREAVLAIALNTGNASNLQRLLGGESWSEQQLEPVLQTLTKADWAFVQSVWDYFESYRPKIAEKEKHVMGKEPVWIEAAPRTVTTADGEQVNLRGGYYPVKYDPRASERAEAHADAELAKQQIKGAYTSATTRRSFTKGRVEEVKGRPLLYSLDGIYNGMQEVIHDLAWHEYLIDANRLLRDKKIAAAMREHYGAEAHQQFKSWAQDVAQGEQAARNAGERALGWVRQGVSVGGLGFNIMSALIQPLGIAQSMVRIGPKYVARGIAKMTGNPIGLADEINAKSEFMRTRFLTRSRELAEVRSQVKGQSKARKAIDVSAYYLMLRAQQLADMPTWWGGYEKAIAEGNDEERAVALADQAVIDSQGSGTTKDLSAIERGGPAQKLFTTFYSYFNTTLNLAVQKTMNSESKAELAADYLMLFVVPVVLGAILKDALTPGDAGDDDWKKLAKKLIGEEISYMFGLVFGLREFAGAAQAATGTAQYGTDYSGPAGLRLITDTYKLANQAHQGELDPAFRKAIINVAGELLRLPAAQINRSITGLEALKEGKTHNPAAVVLGYQEPH